MKHLKKRLLKESQSHLTQTQIEQTQLGCQISQATMQMMMGL